MKKMKRLLLALLSVTCIGVAAAGFAGCVGGSSSRQSSIGGGQGNTGNSGDVGTTESYCYISTDSYTDEYGVAGTYTEYNDKKFVVGTEVSLEATVNDGYNFEGWFVDGTCMSTDLVYEFEAKNDLWVVAEYSYYTVSTWGDGDDYETAGTYTKMEDQKVSAGEQVVLTATVNDGYNFEGWYIGAWSDVCVSTDLTYTFTMEKENKEIYAKYSYYVVNTWGDGDDYETAGTYTKMEDQKVSAGTKVTLTATVNDGYNFEGW
ncbi:MAG: InlB B-repeat-containing protein, partial [Clostridia bacterium]|nr:InlB B-repeat-containing protein [Clostridia bacterium]